MTDPVRSLARLEWQAALLLAVVFGAGAAVGAAVDHWRSAAIARPIAGPPPEAGQPPRGRLPRWLEDINLSQDEHEKIRTILDAQRPKIDAIMNGILPKLQAISDTTFVVLRAALTPEHQIEFDRARPQRALAPGMPGGDGRGDGRGPPPRDGRGPPPRDGRGPPPRP